MIRVWCRAYSAQLADQESYLPWVVEEFSGVLCVDEVYQGQLALLLAVDPAAPSGDRLVGYQLVTGTMDRDAVDAFLTRLKEAGISPEEVITDGSSLYPSLLAEIWPAAAHQLCLFHETRHVTTAVATVLTQVRRSLPTPPPRPRQGRGGPLSPVPPTQHRDDPATQQWHLRRARRHAELTEVHELARQGYSQHAIARQTGRNRRTIRRWLSQEIPVLSDETREVAARAAVGGEASTLRRRRSTPERQARLRELAERGLSHSAIARITGLHRVTVGRWLTKEPPAEAADQEGDGAGMPTDASVPLPTTEPIASEESPSQDTLVVPPPAPWTSWTQVREVREALKEHRGLLLRRPDHLSPEHQDTIDALIAGPAGDLVGVARGFLVDWYALWQTEEGQRASWEEAQERYERWRTDPAFQAVPASRQVQDRMTPARFARLSQFLRHPHFEATNNGAERMGRAFRHGQAPHFRLRSEVAIDGALRVVMAQTKERASVPAVPLPRLCSRGRCSRSSGEAVQAA